MAEALSLRAQDEEGLVIPRAVAESTHAQASFAGVDPATARRMTSLRRDEEHRIATSRQHV